MADVTRRGGCRHNDNQLLTTYGMERYLTWLAEFFFLISNRTLFIIGHGVCIRKAIDVNPESRSVYCVLCDIVTEVKCDGRRDKWTEAGERWEVWAAPD